MTPRPKPKPPTNLRHLWRIPPALILSLAATTASFAQDGQQTPDWSGVQLGLSVEHLLDGKEAVGLSSPFDDMQKIGTFDLSGSAVELQAHYRWRHGNLVFGPLLTLTAAGVTDDFSSALGSGDTARTAGVGLHLRAGVLMPDHATLLFAQAGLAHAWFDYQITAPVGTGTARIDTEFSSTGYVLGLGVERKLTNRLSVVGSLEYSNYGKTRLSDGLGHATNATPEYSAAKIGVLYGF